MKLRKVIRDTIAFGPLWSVEDRLVAAVRSHIIDIFSDDYRDSNVDYDRAKRMVDKLTDDKTTKEMTQEFMDATMAKLKIANKEFYERNMKDRNEDNQ